MRRQLGHGLLLVTLLVMAPVMAACGGDDDSPSASSTNGSTDVSTGDTTAIDGSGVTVPDSGSAGSSTTVKGAGSSTTVAGSTGTTVAGSTGTGTTVAGSTATTVAGSTATTLAGSAATTAPPATNAVPQSIADLVLRADGIGSLRFGANVDAVVAGISAVLGPATSDAPAAYPEPAGDGSFKSLDPEGNDDLGFIKPFGRTVCWPKGLCIESAGDTAGPYAFVGWYYAATDQNELATVDGLTVGSLWSDFTGVMDVQPGGCYTIGNGTSAGISLTLQSDGVPFSDFDADGNPTEAIPDPADVSVVQMQAGEQVIFLIGDC